MSKLHGYDRWLESCAQNAMDDNESEEQVEGTCLKCKEPCTGDVDFKGYTYSNCCGSTVRIAGETADESEGADDVEIP